MDASNNNTLPQNSLLPDVNEWDHQQVDFQAIKPEQQLGSSYESPIRDYVPVSSPNDPVIKLDPQDEEEYAEMQRLSQSYTPEVQGPLVGDLKSSKALAIEYANADPTYVRKTARLSHKYDSYRTIRGDGNCGWRAVAFGFFELLLRSGDHNRIGMEHARISSLSGLMDSVGFQSYIYEDFAEATYNLFSTLGAGTFSASDDAVLLSTFNDPGVSDAIVTHFKFLTSAWMKHSPAHYEPFLDRPVAEHCGTHIEPYGVEIDHVGLMALIDCLILPAGLAVEIIYLDRSAGDDVNVHRFEKLDGDGVLTPPDAPVLRLLYRPGHYDIVYKMEDLPASAPEYRPSTQPIQVAFLSSLPGPQFMATPAAGPYFFSDMGYDMQPPSNSPGNFRQSMLSIPEFQPTVFQPLPFQTTTFKNSPFNPSHFQSENFQPEIYQPPTSPGHKRHDRRTDSI